MTTLPTLQQNDHENFVALQRFIPRVLKELANGGNIERLSKSLSIKSSTLESWQQVSNCIRALSTNRRNRQVPRHINPNTAKKGIAVFPAPAKTAVEFELQGRIFNSVAKITGNDQAGLKKFFYYFLTNYSISAKGIQFQNEKYLKHYLSRLRSLGIYKKEICLTLLCKNASVIDLQTDENRLKKQYSDAGSISVLPYEAIKDKRYPITVRVIEPDNPRNNMTTDLFYSNYGFRSAIYLLSIALFMDTDLN